MSIVISTSPDTNADLERKAANRRRIIIRRFEGLVARDRIPHATSRVFEVEASSASTSRSSRSGGLRVRRGAFRPTCPDCGVPAGLHPHNNCDGSQRCSSGRTRLQCTLATSRSKCVLGRLGPGTEAAEVNWYTAG